MYQYVPVKYIHFSMFRPSSLLSSGEVHFINVDSSQGVHSSRLMCESTVIHRDPKAYEEVGGGGWCQEKTCIQVVHSGLVHFLTTCHATQLHLLCF